MSVQSVRKEQKQIQSTLNWASNLAIKLEQLECVSFISIESVMGNSFKFYLFLKEFNSKRENCLKLWAGKDNTEYCFGDNSNKIISCKTEQELIDKIGTYAIES